ncbi:hypothetical protein CMK18_00530 [Candidatus Poribacteria bacterium]|nr:hypothetical protein [Candidatus Poribacteria bacterium]
MFESLSECGGAIYNKESNGLTTSFVQAYRINKQQRVYDLTEDVFFMPALSLLLRYPKFKNYQTKEEGKPDY